MRTLVVGLAVTGVAVAQRLRAEGHDVVIVEDAPGASPRYRERVEAVRAVGAELVEAPDAAKSAELGAAVDLVVPSPLVRETHPSVAAARAAGVPVRAEIDLAAERAAMPIVAVTGTNGKTTVTSLTAAMLAASGKRALAAGNIGRPLIDAVGDDLDVIVAEVSSFQLAFTDVFRPKVAVMMAVTPDHLDWHGSFAAYVDAKARITARQTPDDTFVYDADDPEATGVASRTVARSIPVSIRPDAREGFRVEHDALVASDGAEIATLRDMRRALLHDRTNALASAAAALAVGGTRDGARDALGSYETMRHRVELIGEARGVRWYDDSKATNPDATLRALASFESVVLLAGGRNKGLDLSVLTKATHLRAVVAFGEAGTEVAAAFEHGTVPVTRVQSMRDAVRAADELARSGDVVLLSPACASFDAYDNYGARGDDFAAEVRRQVLEPASP